MQENLLNKRASQGIQRLLLLHRVHHRILTEYDSENTTRQDMELAKFEGSDHVQGQWYCPGNAVPLRLGRIA